MNPSNPENLDFLKSIPLDLEITEKDYSEDKLIFEDEFRDVLIQKNMKLMKSHQAELFTIIGTKEIKETIIEMKEKQIVDEILGLISLDEIDSSVENPKEEIEEEESAAEKLKHSLNMDLEINEKDKNLNNRQPVFDFYANNNSHFKQENLYQDHNITMILKMSHTDDEEEKQENYSDNKQFNLFKDIKNYSNNNINNLTNENDLFINNSKIQENKNFNANFKRQISDFNNTNSNNNEYNSNNLNQEIKNELNNRNNLLSERIHFNNNNFIENNIEEGKLI